MFIWTSSAGCTSLSSKELYLLSDRLNDFLSPFPDVTRTSMSTVFLLAQLDSMLSFDQWSKCFLSLELTDTFKCTFVLDRFPVYFNLFVLLFLIIPCLVVTVQSCMEWIPIIKKVTEASHIFFFKKSEFSELNSPFGVFGL